jgi:RNA polymerase sigma-70 factor (ECF subfamily)
MQNGNAKAFDELYRRYAKKMLYFFYQRLWQDNDIAQDFLQDLFMKIIQKPNLYNKENKLSTWIYSMAYNMCKNEYRRESKRGTGVSDIELEGIEDQIPTMELADHLDSNLFNTLLEKELGNLEDNHRLTFILRYKEELTIREISEIMQCVEGTTKSRLFYIIKKLSVRLKMFDPKVII